MESETKLGREDGGTVRGVGGRIEGGAEDGEEGEEGGTASITAACASTRKLDALTDKQKDL